MKWISERESAHLEELIAKAEAEPDAVYEQPPRAYLREAAEEFEALVS